MSFFKETPPKKDKNTTKTSAENPHEILMVGVEKFSLP
jgi:hypothetical protein